MMRALTGISAAMTLFGPLGSLAEEPPTTMEMKIKLEDLEEAQSTASKDRKIDVADAREETRKALRAYLEANLGETFQQIVDKTFGKTGGGSVEEVEKAALEYVNDHWLMNESGYDFKIKALTGFHIQEEPLEEWPRSELGDNIRVNTVYKDSTPPTWTEFGDGMFVDANLEVPDLYRGHDMTLEDCQRVAGSLDVKVLAATFTPMYQRCMINLAERLEQPPAQLSEWFFIEANDPTQLAKPYQTRIFADVDYTTYTPTYPAPKEVVFDVVYWEVDDDGKGGGDANADDHKDADFNKLQEEDYAEMKKYDKN